MQPVQLPFPTRFSCFGTPGEQGREACLSLPFPLVHHPRVNSVLRRQLRRRQFATQGFKSNFRFEIRTRFPGNSWDGQLYEYRRRPSVTTSSFHVMAERFDEGMRSQPPDSASARWFELVPENRTVG